MKTLRVLILFERSGIIREEFRKLGHDAASVDLQDTLIPGPHIRADIEELLTWNEKATRDTIQERYHLVIAHPPCTAVAVSGNRYYAGTPERQKAIDLIKRIWDIPIKHLCIENPVGQINTYYPRMPKPQYIQPWQFGHPESKKTGLWKRNLPDIVPTHVLPKPDSGHWQNQTKSGQNKLSPSPDRADIRSQTYLGIAMAIANQWSDYLCQND